MRSRAQVPTVHAARYMTQLAKRRFAFREPDLSFDWK